MKKILVALFACLSFSAFAQEVQVFVDANKIHNGLNASSQYQEFFSYGYVIAISDALDRKGMFCLPKGVTQGQIQDTVKKYLNDNPQKRHMAAFGVIAQSLSENYPCKKTAPKG